MTINGKAAEQIEQRSLRLLDWIDDKCRRITAEKKNDKRYYSNMLALKTD